MIKNVIEGSGLTQEEKSQWKDYLPLLPDFALRELRANLEMYPELARFITRNWEMKKSLFQKEKGDAQYHVLEKEKEQLEEFMKDSRHGRI